MKIRLLKKSKVKYVFQLLQQNTVLQVKYSNSRQMLSIENFKNESKNLL